MYLFSGAIHNENNPELTVLGKKMTAFPIDPKYSKILLCAPEYNCLEEVLNTVIFFLLFHFHILSLILTVLEAKVCICVRLSHNTIFLCEERRKIITRRMFLRKNPRFLLYL